MYKKNTDKDLVTAALTAALGAGIVTSWAVNQGQHPLVALSITAFAALCGVICHQFDLI
jgi:L-cysteine desulfidase